MGKVLDMYRLALVLIKHICRIVHVGPTLRIHLYVSKVTFCSLNLV